MSSIFWSFFSSASFTVKRSAFEGTASTPFFSSVKMVTLAVRPGFSFRSALGADITTWYVTTLLSVVACWRTCVTCPSKWSSGKASTVKLTRCPSFTPPMSASSMSAMTRMSVKSLAMVNSSGVLNEAATVWPSSTLFDSTTPSMGLVMVA